MTLFQWIVLPLLLAIVGYELLGLWHRRGLRGVRMLRLAVWVAATVAIAAPELTHLLASFAGIRRGADLVLYLFLLAFLGASFGFYARQVRLQRQFTELVRHVAIREARFQDSDVAGAP